MLAAVFILSACNNSGVKSSAGDDQVMPPDWFYNPGNNQYLGVTGAAPVQDFGGIDAQRRVALIRARAELGRIAKVHVDSENNINTTVNSNGVVKSSNSYIKLTSAEVLDLIDAEIKEEWIHPKTGELYIWLVLPHK